MICATVGHAFNWVFTYGYAARVCKRCGHEEEIK